MFFMNIAVVKRVGWYILFIKKTEKQFNFCFSVFEAICFSDQKKFSER